MVDLPGWLTLALAVSACAVLPAAIALVRWWDARSGG